MILHIYIFTYQTYVRIIVFFDGSRHLAINEDTYDLDNYCAHAYLEEGTNFIDGYRKFEQLPDHRIIIGEMNTDKSNEVIEILKRYYNK